MTYLLHGLWGGGLVCTSPQGADAETSVEAHGGEGLPGGNAIFASETHLRVSVKPVPPPVRTANGSLPSSRPTALSSYYLLCLVETPQRPAVLR